MGMLKVFFMKKVNPFSIKSEPILQNESIRILYPFCSPFTKTQNVYILRFLLFFAENELISIFFAEKETILKQELLHTPEF